MLSARDALSRQSCAHLALKNTWKLSSVSAFDLWRRNICSLCPLAKAIDRYIETQADGTEKPDPRLKDIIESIFRRCIEDGDFKQARTSLVISIMSIDPV